jgi:RHS repeat-associated protein
VGLTNAAGTVVERYTYSAYGTLGIYAANGTVRSSSPYANRYTYTGREWDAELRLYHFRARWYDPATGGFVSRDPLGYIDGMSLYRGYFGVRGVDPTGLNCTWNNNGDPILISGVHSRAYCAVPTVSVGGGLSPASGSFPSEWVGCECSMTATYHQTCKEGWWYCTNIARFPTKTITVNFVEQLPNQDFVICEARVGVGIPIIGNGTVVSATFYNLDNDKAKAAKRLCDMACNKAVPVIQFPNKP